MNQRHIMRILGVGVCAGSLVVAACSKNEDPQAETGTTTQGGGEGDGDGDNESGDETGGGGKDTGDPGDGDGDDDPTTSTTMGFVPDNDIAGANTCDPWAQDCPEGEKCAAYNSAGDTWDANKCVPLMGTGRTGDPCTYFGSTEGTDDCDVGHMCYYINEEANGICVPLCSGSADDPICEEQFNCSISNDGSLLLCLYACDPLLQDCEQEGSGCFWDGSQFNCDPAGDIPTNEPCGYINDCLPGHLCLDAAALPDCAGSACCSTWCDLAEPQCGVANTECIAFYDEGTAPPGLESTGICAIPGS